MRFPSIRCPRTLCLGSLITFSAAGLLSPVLLAQSQDASVAEAARKTKEQKKPAPRGNVVITDDTLSLRAASADTGAAPPAGTVINTTPVPPEAGTTTQPAEVSVTPPAEPTKSTDTPAPGMDTAAPAPVDVEKAEEQAAEIAEAKEMLAQVGTELDLLKRQLVLDSESYYSQPDYAHDVAGKAKLDEQQRLIGEKQASLEELKERLEKLMQEAGVSPEAEQTPATPTL